jgi:hypothetical protein
MSKYSDFDIVDVRGRVRLVLLTVGFAMVGLLEWMFGHPTDKEELLGVALFLFMLVLEYQESTRQYVVRLNEITKERHEEIRNDLAKLRTNLTEELRDLDKSVYGRLRDLDKSVSDELRDLDKAVFDLSLKIGD